MKKSFFSTRLLFVVDKFIGVLVFVFLLGPALCVILMFLVKVHEERAFTLSLRWGDCGAAWSGGEGNRLAVAQHIPSISACGTPVA